jgi:hypothetical protein
MTWPPSVLCHSATWWAITSICLSRRGLLTCMRVSGL